MAHPPERNRHAAIETQDPRVGNDGPMGRIAKHDRPIAAPAHLDHVAPRSDGILRQIGNVHKVTACRMEVGTAPGDPGISSQGDERQPWRHEADCVV